MNLLVLIDHCWLENSEFVGTRYQDSDLLPAEVERDGPAELGGGAGQEHLLDIARDLVQDHGRRQRVAVHHPHL